MKNLFKLLYLFQILIFSYGVLYAGSDLNQNLFSGSENFNKLFFNDSEDSSGFSSDGPVIIYEDEKIISYSIKPESNSFFISVDTINRKDSLSCFVDETGQSFKFQLKESINIETDLYDIPDKMLVISDIEGNFKGLSMILKASGVINDQLNWIFGNGHLVLPGDYFDRGINVTECLWLIYKLESEAELAGGKVHFILGNHEVMNLREQFKYVRLKYLVNADSLTLDYKKWYSNNSELGRWLRSKNAVEKIGNFLFLHGGISKNFPSDTFSVNDINENIRISIDKLFGKGESSKDKFIGSIGPLWYRGLIEGEETQEEFERTLSNFNISKMIAGHTLVDQIKYFYNEKLIAIDLEHQENSDNGIMYALWYEKENFYIIDNSGLKTIMK